MKHVGEPSFWRRILCTVLFFAVMPSFAKGTEAASTSGRGDAISDVDSAPRFSLSGHIFTDLYAPTTSLDNNEFNQVSASLWLQGDAKLSETASARFIFEGDRFERSTGYPPQFRTDLREGYVDHAAKGLELRIGRQIISWGKSDVINPTDFLSAKDYTFFNPDEEVRRSGATGISLSYAPGAASGAATPWNLTAVVLPVFAQSKLLIPPMVLPSAVTLATAPVAPPVTVANTETAFKVSYLGEGWDASLSAYRGWNHWPNFTVNSITGAPPSLSVSLGQAFTKTHAAGGDLAYTAGSYTFRVESAYAWTGNDDASNPLVIPTHWDTVVGIERPFLTDCRLQAQFVSRYFPRFVNPGDATGPDPMTAYVNRQVANANALLLNYQDRYRPASTLRVSYNNEQHGIEAEIFAWLNFVGGDYLIRPKLAYAMTDALKLTLGFDGFYGPEDRPLGSLRAYRSLFLEAKYGF